jgi:hypothetical protein
VKWKVCERDWEFLLQLGVFRLGLNQNRNIRVGVLPQGEKILIRGAGFERVALHRVGASQLEMRQHADGFVEHKAAMVEDFLKLCRRFAALTRGKIGFSSHINGVQIGPIVKLYAAKPSS